MYTILSAWNNQDSYYAGSSVLKTLYSKYAAEYNLLRAVLLHAIIIFYQAIICIMSERINIISGSNLYRYIKQIDIL